jgi:long-chain acyl-CoA synthetase
LTGEPNATLSLSPGLKEYLSYSIKNLVKLQSGEYIALERLESVYKSCNLVSNLCVHATPDATQPIAIIVPNEVHLRASLPGEDPHASLADLCEKPKVHALILKECNAAGKKSGFKGIEMLQGVVLTTDEWTPESGLVTAAQKIQRKKVAQRYDAEIKVRSFFFLPSWVGLWIID